MTQIRFIRALHAVFLHTRLPGTRQLTSWPSSTGLLPTGLLRTAPSCAKPLRPGQSRQRSALVLLAQLLWQTSVFAGSPDGMVYQTRQATADTTVTIIKTVAPLTPSVASRIPLIVGTHHTDIKMPIVLCIHTDLSLHTLDTVMHTNLTGVNTLATSGSTVDVVRHSEHCRKTETAVLIKISNTHQATFDQFVGELALTVTAR